MSRWWGLASYSNQLVVDAGQLVSWSAGQLVLVVLDGGGGQGGDLLPHTVSNTGAHGGASGHDGVGGQVLPDVHVALHDGGVGGHVDAAGLHAQEAGLEEGLRAPEPLVADGDEDFISEFLMCVH